MKRLVKVSGMILVFALAIATAPVVFAKHHPKHDGPTKPPPRTYDTVANIDTEKFTIDVLGKDGKKTTTYGITQFSKIVVNGKPGKFDAVKKGMKVSVNSTDGKTASRIDADDYTSPEGAVPAQGKK